MANLVTPYIEQKELARISREVVFPLLGYLIGEILQDFKSESIQQCAQWNEKRFNLVS